MSESYKNLLEEKAKVKSEKYARFNNKVPQVIVEDIPNKPYNLFTQFIFLILKKLCCPLGIG